MRKGKRTLQKELVSCLAIDDHALKIIVDSKNIDYYLLRAIECIHSATPETFFDEIDKAILLLAIAKQETRGVNHGK